MQNVKNNKSGCFHISLSQHKSNFLIWSYIYREAEIETNQVDNII